MLVGCSVLFVGVCFFVVDFGMVGVNWLILVDGCFGWSLVVACWLMVDGCRLLVSCWSLVVPCWLLIFRRVCFVVFFMVCYIAVLIGVCCLVCFVWSVWCVVCCLLCALFVVCGWCPLLSIV